MIHPTADVESGCVVAHDAKIWHYAHLREDCSIGHRTIIGRGAYIDHGVFIGDDCKIQNYALIYAPAKLNSGVFIGPGVKIINDPYPRAVNPDLTQKSDLDWEPQGVLIDVGASIGAGAIILPGVTIGRWAVVAAGAVVTHDVPPYTLDVGIPARDRVKKVCKCFQPDCDRSC